MNKLYQYIITSLIILIVYILPCNSQNYIIKDITKDHPLENDITLVILETQDGLIWLGTKQSGLWIYDGYNFKNIDPKDFELNSNIFNSILSLYESLDKRIFVGTKYNGVYILDTEAMKGSKLKAVNKVNMFHQDNRSIIWMATNDGLKRYNIKKNEFKLFETNIPPHQHNNKNPSIFRAIKSDPIDSTILWIGGINGLFSFNKQSQKIIRHMHPLRMHIDIGDMDFLGPQHRQYLITQIEIIDKSMFLATWGGGLMEYKPETNFWKKYTFQPYTSNDELDENIINGMAVLDEKIYFTSNTNIGYLNLRDRSMNTLNSKSLNSKKNFYALLKDKNNILWSSSLRNGIHKIKSKNKFTTTATSLNKLIVNDINIDSKKIYEFLEKEYPDTLILKPNNNKISLNVNLINPIDTTNTEYQYKLSGLDHGWIPNGKSSSIEYSNLPSGKYILHVRARCLNGNWSELSSIFLHRKVHFYKKIWFWIISFLGLGLISYLIYRFRISNIKKQALIENQITELKLQALQAQMNPHFTFNALNSINSFIMSNKTEEASDFLTKFSRLIRQVLNISKEKIISLDDEIKALKLYIEMEQMRFVDKFDFEINVAKSIDQKSVFILPLTLQPYVENAIWHGLMHKDGKGILKINVEEVNSHICIEIIDNGIGIKNSKKYKSEFKGKKKSFGMSISKSRLEIINKIYNFDTEIVIEEVDSHDTKNPGTIVRIKIPAITEQNVEL